MSKRITERHLNAFASEDKKHLEQVRELRCKAWHDEDLELLDKAVLGLTGSAEQLAKYNQLAARIGKLIGEPIIRIESERNGRVEYSAGGIISGEMRVSSCGISEKSGHAILAVPVKPYVSVHDTELGFSIYTGKDTNKTEIRVAHIINHEWENKGNNPGEDYYDDARQPVLLGREAIYQSEYFHRGLGKALLAIENTAKKSAEQLV